jgi:polyisoprenoid-binding protein YceI
MLRKFIVRLAALALLAPALAAAETHEFDVDRVHSQVGFKVKHIVANVPGHFGSFSGKVWLDPANVAGTLKIEGTIQTASIDTDNERRDGHLKSPDFFEAEKHPEITFVSKSVTAKADNQFEVVGDLTMKGVTKPATLSVEYLGLATHPSTGTPTIGLDATGKVNRMEYGISWNKTLDAGGLLVGETVTLDVHIEATVPKTEEKAG